ncbi:unnamed protein product [Eretmochelys imbricata]
MPAGSQSQRGLKAGEETRAQLQTQTGQTEDNTSVAPTRSLGDPQPPGLHPRPPRAVGLGRSFLLAPCDGNTLAAAFRPVAANTHGTLERRGEPLTQGRNRPPWAAGSLQVLPRQQCTGAPPGLSPMNRCSRHAGGCSR